MSNNTDAVSTSEARALGGYALRRISRTERAKFNFVTHMLQKRHRFFHFNPFEHSRRRDRHDQGAPSVSQTKGGSELKKLKQVTREAQQVITTSSSFFPFVLFPDTITIDRHKLTIIYRIFFMVEQTVSVPLKDVKNIQADMGPFFGSLTITSDHFINNTQTIKFLPRRDVKKIQEIVQGAMVANNESIDISKVEAKELETLLIDLGKGHISSA